MKRPSIQSFSIHYSKEKILDQPFFGASKKEVDSFSMKNSLFVLPVPINDAPKLFQMPNNHNEHIAPHTFY
jgi:hypothetical protein